MEDVTILGLIMVFGGFLFFIVIVCSLRIKIYLKEKEGSNRPRVKHGRKSKSDHKLMSSYTQSEAMNTNESTRYADHGILPDNLCENYSYRDRTTTGLNMSMSALRTLMVDIPIAIATTNTIGDHRTSYRPPPHPANRAPSPFVIVNETGASFRDLLPPSRCETPMPPPDYDEARRLRMMDVDIRQTTPPPPSYQQCIENDISQRYHH